MNDDTHHGRADERASNGSERSTTDRTETTALRGDTRRRDFLRVVGGGAVLGTVGVGGVGAAPDSMEFVETDGTDFVVGGEPVYFSGSNNFWITDAYVDRQRVDDVLALFDDMGLNLVRTFTACEGTDDENAHCMQPTVGVHDEGALEHLDYIVARARERGIRLVLTFADYWAHNGGMDEYVRASSTARPESEFDRDTWAGEQAFREQFYTDEECRDYYRNHVETILTRENSITGVEYRNEPAIAMWELANEPRAGQAGVDVLHDWFADMSAYVKELDDEHLVTTGMEGFYDQGRDGGGGPDWAYGGGEGTAYVDHHRIDTIDVCSFHMYPYHWDFPLENGGDWIQEHVVDARERVGKPAYLGEFNVNAQENDLATRNEYLERWYDALDEYDAEAATIWQVVLEDTQDHDGFQVYRSESGDIVENYTETATAKSGSGGPIADGVAPSTLRIGESGSFDAAYSFVPDGSVAEYEWAFGDGTTASGESVTHRFGSTGTYETELTVTDAGGTAATDEEVVTVEDVPEDSFVVEGAGETVEGDTKEFHFASEPRSGDFVVEAYLADMTSTATGAQAGIMVADDPASPGALGAITVTPDEGAELTRAYTDQVWRERVREGRSPPIWLRLERSGGEVTGYASPDGDDWTEIHAGEVDLPADAHVGLFVSSNSPGDLCTAQFDGVDWLEDWTSTDVGDVEAAGHAVAGGGESGGGSNADPTAAIDAGATDALVDETVTFDAGASSDADGSIESYAWTFGDGTSATGAQVEHAFAAAGEYDVTLTVTDDEGATDADAVTVSVSTESAPDAPSNLAVAETSPSSITVAWDGVDAAEHYVVSVDGSVDHEVETTSTTVDGLEAGTGYEIGVSAVGADGSESGATTIAAATDEDVPSDGDGAVNAELEPSTTEASVGERITFHVRDTTGDRTWLTDLQWEFGDGTTASGWWNAHSYDSAGTYTVALTATDNEGTATTHDVEITVTA